MLLENVDNLNETIDIVWVELNFSGSPRILIHYLIMLIDRVIRHLK